MQTSGFQICLIASMAMALGATLRSGPAIGYPAAATVSTGVNPVVNYGGTIYDYGDESLFTAPADQDVVITDVVLTPGETNPQCRGLSHVRMTDGSSPLAEFHVGLGWGYSSGTGSSRTDFASQTQAHFQSGLRVPAGSSLSISVERMWSEACHSGMDIAYVISGYVAQP